MQNLIILLVAVYLLDAISLWRLFQLAGQPAYKAFIPLYNRYTQLEILERPKWWVIILLVPVVGVLFHFALHADFIRCFGKRKFIDGLLVFLTLGLYVTYINYDKNTKYVGIEERKETFVASIIFAIIFATAVHIFIAQPFIIPTSSMENTLRRGDFLIVNKLAYGSRIPMTPIGLPFLQNKIPKTGKRPGDQIDSYVDAFRIPYTRIPGYEAISNNSLVVFNYPTDSLHTAIDRKDPYVKRCVAIPGDSLQIINGVLYINGKAEQLPADAERQYSYYVETDGTELTPKMMEKEINFISTMTQRPQAEYLVKNAQDPSITKLKGVVEDNIPIIDSVIPYNDGYKMYSKLNLERLLVFKDSIPALKGTEISMNRVTPLYWFDGLSDKMVAQLKSYGFIKKVTKDIEPKGIKDVRNYPRTNVLDSTNTIFPEDKNWNRDFYGPLHIPKKGDIITLNKENMTQYFNLINHYEENPIEIKNNQIMVDGKAVESVDYTVQKDYYFMMGDNRHMSLDSRFFGYVPHDHVMGKPSFWWMSVQGMFDNGSFKIRFNRMFKVPNNGVPMDEKFNWGWIIIPLIIIFFVWDDRRRKKKKKTKHHKSMDVVLPSCYFPPISYFIYLENSTQREIDIHENFIKQTYRNRCEILGANGRMSLIIPIQHQGKRPMKDCTIDYHQNWQKIHRKSLQSAYQRSPYFEYYEDRLLPIFETQPKYLVDWNQKALEQCIAILSLDKPIIYSTEYVANDKFYDARPLFSPKIKTPHPYSPYTQVFEDRFEFQDNLSIFDLICNIGPEAHTYIQKNLNNLQQ